MLIKEQKEKQKTETSVANSTQSDTNINVKNNIKKKTSLDYDSDNNREFKDKVVKVNKISKTVKGGRRLHFNALVVVGNLKGNYGFALKKSNEVSTAIKKALKSAQNNIYNVHISSGDTIAYDVFGKYGATKVFLKSAPVGTGIIAGGPTRAILELIGFKNIISKVYGSRTSINVIRATHNAICKLKTIYLTNKIRNSK